MYTTKTTKTTVIQKTGAVQLNTNTSSIPQPGLTTDNQGRSQSPLLAGSLGEKERERERESLVLLC